MRALYLAVALLGIPVATGCPSGDDDDDADGCPEGDDVDCHGTHDVPLEFEVGLGDPTGPTFEPLPEGGVAMLYPGPQGGYHVYLQVRARGLCPNRIVYERRIREPGASEDLWYQITKVPFIADPEEDGSWVLPRSDTTFVCPARTSGVATHGRDLELEVTLTEELVPCDENAGLDDAPRSLARTITLHPTCAESDTVCQQSTDIGCAAPP